MKNFPMTSLLIIVVIVIGFFAWQFQLHNQYTELSTCTGDKFADNTCSFGAGCDTGPGALPGANIRIPTSRDAALEAVDDYKSRKEPELGRCVAWLDFMIQPDTTIDEQQEL